MKKINIGDWVTQYRTGYWKVKELALLDKMVQGKAH